MNGWLWLLVLWLVLAAPAAYLAWGVCAAAKLGEGVEQ